MVSYLFLKNFIGKKVLLNVDINGSERFYTGDITEGDDESESVLLTDKFGIMMSVCAKNISKVEEFDPNHKKNSDNHSNKKKEAE